MDALVVAMVPRVNEKVLEDDEEMTLWFIATTAKSQVIQSINVPF